MTAFKGAQPDHRPQVSLYEFARVDAELLAQPGGWSPLVGAELLDNGPQAFLPRPCPEALDGLEELRIQLLHPIGAISRAQPWREGIEALRSRRVQLQQAPIPQPPQDLTGAEGIDTHQAAQAGVVDLGVAVRLQQRPKLLIAELLSTDA